MRGRSLGWEDPLGEGVATHSSILAWRFPWTEGPGSQWSTGSQRVRCNQLKQFSKHAQANNKQNPLNVLGIYCTLISIRIKNISTIA